MFVRKRGMTPSTHFHLATILTMPLLDGRQERVQFDKITARVSRLCYGLDQDHVDPVKITQKVISGVYGGVTTVQLDDLVSTPSLSEFRVSYSPLSLLIASFASFRLPRPPRT